MNHKLMPLILAGVLCVQIASAHTRPIADGVSPDGRKEVVVSAPNSLTRDPGDAADTHRYRLVIRVRPTGKVLFEKPGQWQHSFFGVGTDGYDLRAYWNADSRWVALVFDGPNHNRLIRLFAMQGSGSAREVFLPDFARAVTGALAGSSLKSLDVEPCIWSGHRLNLRISGTSADPDPRTATIDFSFSAFLRAGGRGRHYAANLSALQQQPSPPPSGT